MPLKFGPTGKLPQGEHPVTWDELERRFGFSFTRKKLLQGLLKGCRILKAAGVKTLYVDGSFATKKATPSDFDSCYELGGVDFNSLPAPFQTFDNKREAQKKEFFGEFFPASAIASLGPPPEPYRSYFQHDKAGRPKGILVLDLDTVPDDPITSTT
jgi:hypothetical protein